MVVAYTVFSSILDGAMASIVALETVPVMKPGGGLLRYDFRYYRPANKDVRGVTAARVHEPFPQLLGRLVGVTLLPPPARHLGPLTPLACPAFGRIPPQRSHLLGLLMAGG